MGMDSIHRKEDWEVGKSRAQAKRGTAHKRLER
jgi:hypothetical protein